MRFICYNDDIPPVGEALFALLKLEHGRKDDAVCLPSLQQGFQMLLTFGLNGRLAKEARAF